MKNTASLSNAAKVAIAMGADSFRGFRAMALTWIARAAQDIARGYRPGPLDQLQIARIARRFRLGDMLATLVDAYRKDLAA